VMVQRRFLHFSLLLELVEELEKAAGAEAQFLASQPSPLLGPESLAAQTIQEHGWLVFGRRPTGPLLGKGFQSRRLPEQREIPVQDKGLQGRGGSQQGSRRLAAGACARGSGCRGRSPVLPSG